MDPSLRQPKKRPRGRPRLDGLLPGSPAALAVNEALRKNNRPPVKQIHPDTNHGDGYKPKYCKSIIQFFNGPPYKEEVTTSVLNGKEISRSIKKANDFPFMVDFAQSIKVHPKMLEQWARRYPAFDDAQAKARKLQEKFLATNALLGLYSQSFAVFTAKNVCRWRDAYDLAGDPENPMKFIIFSDEKNL